MSDESPYDPYIAKGSGPEATHNTTTKDLQKGLDEAVDGMRGNMKKLRERGENIDKLQGQTAALADSAHEFRRGANRVRKQMWWKDMKMRVCIAVGIVLLLVVIIVPAVVVKH